MTERKSVAAGMSVKAGPAGTAQVVIATTGVVDLDGDVVLPGAIGEQVVPLLPSHLAHHIPLGKARTREVAGKVEAALTFNFDVPEARAWHSVLRFDAEHGPPVQEFSWGYDVLKSHPKRLGNKTVRVLEKVRLHEVSLVLRGASIGTGVLDAKTDPATAEIRAIAESFMAERRAEKDRLEAEVGAIHRGWRLRCADDDVHEAGHDYRIVEPAAVELWKQRLVAGVAANIADRFRLSAPEVRWFKQDRFTLWGRAYPSHKLNAIAVNAGIADRLGLTLTTAHEVAHLAGMNEADARAYEATIEKELTSANPR